MPAETPSAPPADPTAVSSTPEAPSLVIVGGGFCGTALAVSLLRATTEPLAITLIESGPFVGRGVAYSTDDARHLLNVPARSMSALADHSDHFVRWLERLEVSTRLPRPFGPEDYVPRRIYGAYLRDTLDLSKQEAHPGVTLNVLEDEVVGVKASRRPALAVTRSGERLRADAVVLALGNLPPRRLPDISDNLLASGVYQPDPWRPSALAGLAEDDEVLILGTGLTMVDLVVTLVGSGHRGRIHALSRRGLLPKGHPTSPVDVSEVRLADALAATRPHDLPTLVRQVRRSVKRHAGPWQEVVDSLRSLTPTLWRDLSQRDQARFLRRYRAYWDVHRSRIAPEVAEVVTGALESGQLQVGRGRIVALSDSGTGTARASWQENSKLRRNVTVGRIINATGPETDLRYTSHTLLRQLVASGAIRPDPTGLGISVDASGRVLGNGLAPLYILGSLRRNESYEGIAVPELRVQARDLAATLSSVLRS